MPATLPEVVTRYFAAASARDTDSLLACFAEDGSVTDEGRMMTGHQAIRTWREGANSKYTYTTEVIGTGASDRSTDTVGMEVVIARLEGDFPGSPVELKFRFVLRGDLIASLEIAP